MTEERSFKRRVRERMSKTGESYTSARARLIEKREKERGAVKQREAVDELVAEPRLVEATGRSWDGWFALLDGWGASGKTHGDIARYLTDEQGVPGWWAQTVTVGYERARGMRQKHQRPDGFAISASKTISVPVEVLFEAFVDDGEREGWLDTGRLSLRTAQPGRTARFDWEDGTTRVAVGFTGKGPSKAVVALQHERLRDPEEADRMKAMWREKLGELKALLEA